MAIKRFEFTKDWRNPTDFPTYEPNETQVREDLQYQPEEIKNFLNSLVEYLENSGAADMGASVEGLEANTVEEALSELLSIQKAYEAIQSNRNSSIVNQIENMGSDLEETKRSAVSTIDVNEEEKMIVLTYIDGSTYTVDCSGFATSESLKELEKELSSVSGIVEKDMGSFLVSVYFDEELNGLVMRRKDGTEEFITSIGGGSGSGTVSTANAAIVKQITIPKSGWVNQSGTSDFPYYIDLVEPSAKVMRVPIVIVDDGYHEIARDAKISLNATTSDGTLHLDAKNIPSGDMEATLILIVPGSSESSSTYPDIATDEEVQDVIDDVFGQ